MFPKTNRLVFESDADEAARLAQSPAGSINHFLASLPVTNPHPATGQLVELPRRDGDDRIVGVLRLSRHQYPIRFDQQGRVLRNTSFEVQIVASTSNTYPVGGYDIVIGAAEARRARLIFEETLLQIPELVVVQ